MPLPRHFGPWTVRQRPGGDWVVQQVNRLRGTTSRFGPFATEAEAREQQAFLTGDDPADRHTISPAGQLPDGGQEKKPTPRKS